MAFNHDKAQTITGVANLAQNRAIRKELEAQRLSQEKAAKEQERFNREQEKRDRAKAAADREHQNAMREMQQMEAQAQIGAKRAAEAQLKLAKEKIEREEKEAKLKRDAESKLLQEEDFIFNSHHYANKLVDSDLDPILKYFLLISEFVKFKNANLKTSNFKDFETKDLLIKTQENYPKYLDQIRSSFDTTHESEAQIIEDVLGEHEEDEITHLRSAIKDKKKLIDSFDKELEIFAANQKKAVEDKQNKMGNLDKDIAALESQLKNDLAQLEKGFTVDLIYKILETILMNQKRLSLFSTYRFNKTKCIEALKLLAKSKTKDFAYKELGDHTEKFYDTFSSFIKGNEFNLGEPPTGQLALIINDSLTKLKDVIKSKNNYVFIVPSVQTEIQKKLENKFETNKSNLTAQNAKEHEELKLFELESNNSIESFQNETQQKKDSANQEIESLNNEIKTLKDRIKHEKSAIDPLKKKYSFIEEIIANR